MMTKTTTTTTTTARSLYRQILKAHKLYLPSWEMRQLGDKYVKSEFKLHKTAKPEHLGPFFQGWQEYLEQITQTAQKKEALLVGAEVDQNARQDLQSVEFGRDLPADVQLQDEQLIQLEKLKQEAARVSKSQSEKSPSS